MTFAQNGNYCVAPSGALALRQSQMIKVQFDARLASAGQNGRMLTIHLKNAEIVAPT
jgi:hypothetical protein